MRATQTICIAFLRWKLVNTLSLTLKTTDYKSRWQQNVHVANHCAWLYTRSKWRQIILSFVDYWHLCKDWAISIEANSNAKKSVLNFFPTERFSCDSWSNKSWLKRNFFFEMADKGAWKHAQQSLRPSIGDSKSDLTSPKIAAVLGRHSRRVNLGFHQLTSKSYSSSFSYLNMEL